MRENRSETIGQGSREENDPESAIPADADGETKSRTPISVILAGMVLTILTIICLQVDDWSRDWTQNTSATDPDSTELHLRPIDCLLAPGELADLVIETMQGVPRWKLVKKTEISDERVNIELVHQTFIFGFKDDVEVKIVKTEKGSMLSAKSQSRIGQGDLGQNPRNLRELISRLHQGLAQNRLPASSD